MPGKWNDAALFKQRSLAAADERCAAAQTALTAALQSLKNISAEPLDKQPAAIAQAAANVRLAEADLSVATEEKISTHLRLIAMQAQWALEDASSAVDKKPLEEACKSTSRAAIAAARKLEVAKSQHKLASVELSLVKSSADKQTAIEKELVAAREALTKAEAQVAAENSKTMKSFNHWSPASGPPLVFSTRVRTIPQSFQAQEQRTANSLGQMAHRSPQSANGPRGC